MAQFTNSQSKAGTTHPFGAVKVYDYFESKEENKLSCTDKVVLWVSFDGWWIKIPPKSTLLFGPPAPWKMRPLMISDVACTY